MSVIRQLHQQLVSKERSAVEITQDYLDRIAALEPKLHSYLTVTADQALAQARQVDAKKLPLGMSLACWRGFPWPLKTICAPKEFALPALLRYWKNFVPPYESTVTQKLMEAGAIALGKTNLDEFAMGSSTENSAYQLTGNPWDVERVPGGFFWRFSRGSGSR